MIDIPLQYKPGWDNLVFELMATARKMSAIYTELGCDNVEIKRDNLIVKILTERGGQ